MPTVQLFKEFQGYSVFVEGYDESGKPLPGRLRYFLDTFKGRRILENRVSLPMIPAEKSQSLEVLARNYAQKQLNIINAHHDSFNPKKPVISLEDFSNQEPVDSSPHLLE